VSLLDMAVQGLKEKYKEQLRNNSSSDSKQKEEANRLKAECKYLEDKVGRLEAECLSKDLDVQELKQELVKKEREAGDVETNLKEQLDEMMTLLLEKEQAHDRLVVQLQRYSGLHGAKPVPPP
jgi:chromosome segregation ATPase